MSSLFNLTPILIRTRSSLYKNKRELILENLSLMQTPANSNHLRHPIANQKHQQCPYIGTIKRYLMDFDFEKVCCISLLNNNVYGCLVCGRFFQGKGPKTPAYEHSIEYGHYLYINLQSGNIYCLPDNYEVDDSSLEDIKFNLKPFYSYEGLRQLYKLQAEYNVDGKQYIPGIIGMNDLGSTHYANSIFQVLNVVKSFRQYLLLNDNFKDVFLDKISLFYKKVWNNKNFKGVISPHQIMQTVSEKSSKMFKIGKLNDPSTFFVWLVNTLDKLMKKQKKKNINFLKLFEGQVKTSHIKGIKDSAEYERIPEKVETKNFITLRVEFPEKGIFNKTKNETQLNDMIQKFSGTKGITEGDGLTFMKIIGFPQYLVLVFKRFTKTQYKMQKDSSQVVYNGSMEIQGHKYKLQAQVCHQGQYDEGKFLSYVSLQDRWFKAEDLNIKEVNKKDVLLGQPYIQLYKLVH